MLYNMPLPKYNTIVPGDYIIAGCIYIDRCNLILCTLSGYFGSTALYSILGHYDFGEYRPKWTEKFNSNCSYYDANTHIWLGNLLRCYRDICQINLMPFYNCFCDLYNSKLLLSNTGAKLVNTITDKVLQIPIKFNKTYTIALDCNSDVYMCPAVLSHYNPIVTSIDGTQVNLTDILCQRNNYENVKHYVRMDFRRPITYQVKNTNEDNAALWQRYEKNLYLLIQLPIENYSSVVVLEGDYTNTHLTRQYDMLKIYDFSAKELNEILLSDLSLLQFSDKVSYPFTDRLIEYLLQNVITNRDTIAGNVRTTQEQVYIDKLDGVWTEVLRAKIFEQYFNNKNQYKLDINGFVDKDVEKFLIRR